MKIKLLLSCCLLLSTILLPSCHKDRKKVCDGSFIGLSGISGATHELAIYFMDVNTGDIKDYKRFLPNGVVNKKGVYDVVKNCFYVFNVGDDSILLYRYNFSTGLHGPIRGSAALDTVSHWTYSTLLCNSRADKIYVVTQGYQRNRIFEVAHTNEEIDRKIYEAPVGDTISTPVVDENTGYIYFVSGTTLKKVDPVSGASTIVKAYTDARPDELEYNRNDGTIYGVNRLTNPYAFIRIDPANGNITKLATTDIAYGEGTFHTFDVCNNNYILGNINFISWYDPLHGSIAKRIPLFISGGTNTYYIEQPLP